MCIGDTGLKSDSEWRFKPDIRIIHINRLTLRRKGKNELCKTQ
jgi:hypothetical protein